MNTEKTSLENENQPSCLGAVSKSFASGKTAVIIGKKARHEFEIGEIVTLVLKEPSGLWEAYNEKRGNWWIDELDANVC